MNQLVPLLSSTCIRPVRDRQGCCLFVDWTRQTLSPLSKPVQTPRAKRRGPKVTFPPEVIGWAMQHPPEHPWKRAPQLFCRSWSLDTRRSLTQLPASRIQGGSHSATPLRSHGGGSGQWTHRPNTRTKRHPRCRRWVWMQWMRCIVHELAMEPRSTGSGPSTLVVVSRVRP